MWYNMDGRIIPVTELWHMATITASNKASFGRSLLNRKLPKYICKIQPDATSVAQNPTILRKNNVRHIRRDRDQLVLTVDTK